MGRGNREEHLVSLVDGSWPIPTMASGLSMAIRIAIVMNRYLPLGRCLEQSSVCVNY